MKKFFCLALVLFSAISVFAQEGRTIERTEFDAAMKYRLLKFTRQLYRQTTASEHISPEPVQNRAFSKTVMEFDPSIKIEAPIAAK